MINIMVGPVSSGKTRFLRHVLVDAWEESGLGAPAIYIDGRECKLGTAADLVEALVEAGATWAKQELLGEDSLLATLMYRLGAGKTRASNSPMMTVRDFVLTGCASFQP